MSEDFALHFGIDPEQQEDVELGGSPEVRSVLDDLKAEGIPTDDAEVSSHGYGYGADAFAAGVILTGLATLLASGKRIEENVDAWIRLGSRLKAVLRRLGARRVDASLSEPAALAIATARVAEESGSSNLRVLSSTVTKVWNGSLTPEAREAFLEHPDRYYVFVLVADDARAHVIGMSARGNVVFHNVLSLEHWSYLSSD